MMKSKKVFLVHLVASLKENFCPCLLIGQVCYCIYHFVVLLPATLILCFTVITSLIFFVGTVFSLYVSFYHFFVSITLLSILQSSLTPHVSMGDNLFLFLGRYTSDI